MCGVNSRKKKQTYAKVVARGTVEVKNVQLMMTKHFP
jgi:hypothetical protein